MSVKPPSSVTFTHEELRALLDAATQYSENNEAEDDEFPSAPGADTALEKLEAYFCQFAEESSHRERIEDRLFRWLDEPVDAQDEEPFDRHIVEQRLGGEWSVSACYSLQEYSEELGSHTVEAFQEKRHRDRWTAIDQALDAVGAEK